MNNDTQNLEQQRGFYRNNPKEKITVVVVIWNSTIAYNNMTNVFLFTNIIIPSETQ